MIDPIVELGALAIEFNLGLHVDCCLGGFVRSFFFSLLASKELFHCPHHDHHKVLPWLRQLQPSSVPEFDFRVPAVTSISADTHKYGQAPKGSSVILFRTTQLRRFMYGSIAFVHLSFCLLRGASRRYFSITDWPGGLYMSPTLSGSRSGAVIAATWAALLRIGAAGFRQQAATIAEGIKKLREACVMI